MLRGFKETSFRFGYHCAAGRAAAAAPAAATEANTRSHSLTMSDYLTIAPPTNGRYDYCTLSNFVLMTLICHQSSNWYRKFSSVFDWLKPLSPGFKLKIYKERKRQRSLNCCSFPNRSWLRITKRCQAQCNAQLEAKTSRS